mgnify:CR=1 FL=1
MVFLKKIVSFALILMLFASCFVTPAFAADEPIYGIGFITLPDQCLYSKPSASSDVLDSTHEHDCVIILEEEDDYWYKVIHNLQKGYMYAGCLDIHTEVNVELGHGRVIPGVAYLRSGPGTEYSIVSSGFKGKDYDVIGIYNGWYKLLKDDATCYIRSDLMTLSEIPYQNDASDEIPAFYYLGMEIGEITFEETEPVAVAAPGGYYAPISGGSLLAEAEKYIGTPYVFGGTSPEGFDCSGLVYYALAQLGYPAARTAADQINMGRPIEREDLRAGDLVFFENTYTSGVSHVGIYAGGNKFLHAPNEGASVSYSSLSGYWAEHYCGARRLG